MSLLSRLLLTFGALTLPCTALAQTVQRDIPYTTDTTGTYQGDLYRPAVTAPAPAIVLIHGGSWRSGKKTELRKLATDLAAHGYVCFSIDYDIHPHSFPYSWQESHAAVAFLRAHAADYGIDPARIAVLGTSAGGQLAALVALDPQGPGPTAFAAPQPAPRSESTTAPAPETVSAAVIFNGGFDARPSAWVLRRYLGGRCKTIPEICSQASPDDHIHPGAPPIFVGHGTHDHLIPYSQPTCFISRLQAAGDTVTPFIATGAGHSYWRSHKWYAANLTAAETFLDAQLRKPAALQQP